MVNRVCQALDAEVERFRRHRMDGPYSYVWLDATFLKVRDGGRVVSMAVAIAIGVLATGEREVLGLDVGPSEDGAGGGDGEPAGPSGLPRPLGRGPARRPAEVALDAIQRAGRKDREAVRAAVLATKDYDGVLGRWSFDQNGDTTLTTMSGRQVKDGKFDDANAVTLQAQ
jgi:hypothetical protein